MDASFWKGKRVFITGATGFIGENLTNALLDNGAFVVALIRNQSYTPRFRYVLDRNNVAIVRGDIQDISILEHAISKYEIDSVFHLAACSTVGSCLELPLLTFRTNVLGTWNLLEACRLHPHLIKRVIVASSDKAYGTSEDDAPYTEEMPLNTAFPYGTSKACADCIAHCYGCTYDLPVFVTRSANAYGPGDWNFSRLIPGSIRRILRGQAPVIRNMACYTRDYLFIDDLIRGYLALQDAQSHAGPYNFGTGKTNTVDEILALLLEITGNEDLEPGYMPSKRNVEIINQEMDPSKAKTVLGWEATTELREGLEQTVKWYRSVL